MFFSKNLKKFENLKHCFFSRKEGFSKGCYESLNCGLGSKDDTATVLKNLEFVSKKIGCDKQSLITLSQVHSNKVLYFENISQIKNKMEGDAIVTKIKNVAIGILAADCVPILFYDPLKKIIGCAHAGWKGALNGIIENTIQKFYDLGSKSNDLFVAVGPCIGQKNYIVKKDFFNKFNQQNKDHEIYFDKINHNKYMFNLRGFVNNEISKYNIQNVENIKKDTFSDKEFFFSYRRSILNKDKDYGRCISVILMT